jgi:hypothetical protein
MSFCLRNALVMCISKPLAIVLGYVSLGNQVSVVYKPEPKRVAINLLEFC